MKLNGAHDWGISSPDIISEIVHKNQHLKIWKYKSEILKFSRSNFKLVEKIVKAE